MRPDWDDYFFDVASVVGTRATCPRASIGAVLVKNKRIIGSGYNGVPESQPHCPNDAEHMALDHCRDAVHAEYNALANALVPAFGATLYVVGPRHICPNCADRLRENGVTDIRWRASVPDLDAALIDAWVWGCQTFPHATPKTAAEHLRREADELAADPDNEGEIADVLILLSEIARLQGIDLAEAVVSKMAVNRARTWGQPDADGVVEHVREARNGR